MLRCALASILCCAPLAAADHYLSLTVEGLTQPNGYTEDWSRTAQSSGATTTGHQADAVTQAYRLGVCAVARPLPWYWISPAVGIAFGRSRFRDVDTIGEITSYTNVADALVGISLIPNRHVMIDLLPYVGVGRGSAAASGYSAIGFEEWNPEATQREKGLRLGVTFISDRGWTLNLFGGYQKSRVELDGEHTATLSGVTTRYDHTATLDFSGFFGGLGWGYSL